MRLLWIRRGYKRCVWYDSEATDGPGNAFICQALLEPRGQSMGQCRALTMRGPAAAHVCMGQMRKGLITKNAGKLVFIIYEQRV